MKIAVVYWSSTGNTEAMAQAIAEGARKAGASAELFTATEFDGGKVDAFDAIAFGCPAMGAEELEDSEFAPMFESCESKLSGKKIALFGSYGWGGSYMQDWEARVKDAGATLVADGVLALGAPDDEAVAKLAEAGKLLAE